MIVELLGFQSDDHWRRKINSGCSEKGRAGGKSFHIIQMKGTGCFNITDNFILLINVNSEANIWAQEG